MAEPGRKRRKRSPQKGVDEEAIENEASVPSKRAKLDVVDEKLS